MDPLTIALIALRSVGTLFALQGQPKVSEAINAALDAHQAGRNVDAYLQEIADKLESGIGLSQEDWDELAQRINNEVDDFLDNEDET